MFNQDNTVVFLESDSAGLIIPSETGIFYETQTGGYACIQDRVEGFYVPLSYGVVDHYSELHRFFYEKRAQMRADGIDEETAKFVDAELARFPGHAGIVVDRERMNSSREAWIHVLISPPTLGLLLKGRASPCIAVLVWPNSD